MTRIEFEQVMKSFAEALIARRFDVANSFLFGPLFESMSSESLRNEYESMIEYGSGDPLSAQVVNSMTEFPDRERGDAGWVYVAISGPDYAEAISGIVTRDGKIRDLEWGRP